MRGGLSHPGLDPFPLGVSVWGMGLRGGYLMKGLRDSKGILNRYVDLKRIKLKLSMKSWSCVRLGRF